jgi:ABC-type proline/glycine betaine transport system permease subunit
MDGISYELTPLKKYNITRKGGKGSKMSKSNQTTEAPKTSKKYAKTRGEHYKDIVIAILVTAIIAFGLGIKVQADRNAEIAQAVQGAIAPTASAAEEPSK